MEARKLARMSAVQEDEQGARRQSPTVGGQALRQGQRPADTSFWSQLQQLTELEARGATCKANDP